MSECVPACVRARERVWCVRVCVCWSAEPEGRSCFSEQLHEALVVGTWRTKLQQSLLTVLLVRYLPARVLPLSLTASPSVPVLLLLLVLVPMLVLVQADMLCTAVRLVIEFACFLVLKFRHPELPRPYSVPCGNAGAVIITVSSLHHHLVT